MIRLSIPGNACVHCGAVMGEPLACPGCGWADPMTKRPENVDPPSANSSYPPPGGPNYVPSENYKESS